jgi:acyl-CoA thioester hydrolase
MSERLSYQIRLTAPFHDLDPMHVVWHGNYFKYFDIARFGLFREAGIDLYRYSLEKQYIFPITRTSAKYISPLRHQDEFICRADLMDASVKIIIDFEIRRVEDNAVCVKGRSDQVAVKVPEMEMLFEIPHDIRELLGF